MLVGDYYPLTPYSRQLDDWIAWYFNRSETGEGVVQAFRRENSTTSTTIFKLKGLEPDATYTLDDFDTPGTWTATGSELMNNGITISIPARGSAVITYTKN